MSMWIEVARALTAVEAVQRSWARDLQLDGADAFVLMTLARAPLSCATIAMECGRQRQHVQRTLRSLESRGLVAPDTRMNDGRINTWRLAGDGVELARRLEARAHAWQRMVEPAVNLGELVARLTQVLVNQPLNNGWAHALSQPFEVRKLCWDSVPSREPWPSVGGRRAQPERAPEPREKLHQAEAR